MNWPPTLLVAALALALLPSVREARPNPVVGSERPVYIPYPEARPILEALAEVLPADLRKDPDTLADRWPKWAARRDAETRSRLARGDQDSLVNLLMYGTSFTRQPRLTAEYMAGLEAQDRRAPAPSGLDHLTRAFLSRVDDLLTALRKPGPDERLQFMAGLARRQGFRLEGAEGRARFEQHLLGEVSRARKELTDHAKELAAARALGDASQELAARSKLFRNRGISLDTSLLPNLAIEEALRALRERGWLDPGRVRRAAIIGPGLDFVDKDEGYDLYPPQTVQPFALIDTLLRLGLSRAEALEVTALDISLRVNDHLARARERAENRVGYVVQLLRDPAAPWKPETVRYWERFGEEVGAPAAPVPIPAAIGPIQVRAVRIRPEVVARVSPLDVNVVWQRLEPPPEEAFDLVVATNILVYYDVLEQSLALANVERMLRPGGFLLSNNALLELPVSRMRSVGYNTVVYSDRRDHGDHVVWYRRIADGPSPP
jgi:SAM-dependent methyltransferase